MTEGAPPEGSPSLASLEVLAPLPAILVGAFVAAAHGISPKAYVPNLFASVVGAALYAVSRRASCETLAARLPSVAAVLAFGTLLAPGLEGVHRWLPLGPLRLHASSAFAPWVLVGLLSSSRTTLRLTWILLIAIQAVHVVQPDAGQATALAAGALPLLLSPPRRTRAAVGVSVVVALFALVSWGRHDPLPPVDHVERILFLAFASGLLARMAVLLGVGALVGPFVRKDGMPPEARAALGLYLVGAFTVTTMGNFAVPAFGAGAGPVLGWYGLLVLRRASVARARNAAIDEVR
jgi:hypothetical protein